MSESGGLLGWRFIARQLAASPAVVWSIAATTLLGATFVALAPRVLERASQDDLRQTIEQSEPEQRNIEVTRRTRIAVGPVDDPFRNVVAAGEQLVDDMPESVRSVISEQHFVVDTPRFRMSSFPDDRDGPFPTSFRFRYQDDIAEHLTVVDGTMPEPAESIAMLTGPACPDDVMDIAGFEPDERGDHDECGIVDVPVIEAVVSSETASAMELTVGDDFLLRPDVDDPVWFNASSFLLRQRLILRVSGIVEPSDPESEYWYADTSLHRPRITENSDYRIIAAVGILDPTQHEPIVQHVPFVGLDYRWRNLVDATAIDQGGVAELTSDLGLLAPPEATVRTQLRSLLQEFVEQRELTVALMSASVAGVIAAAVATVMVLAILMASRQRDAIVLSRDRGASRGQLVATELVRAAVLVLPPTAVGWSVAALVVSGTGRRLSANVTIVYTVVTVIVLVVASLPLILGRFGRMQRERDLPTLSRSRRLVIEIVVVIVAVSTVMLLRRRSELDEYELGSGNFDTLLAVAPACLALAAGLVLIRVATPLLAIGGWAGSRRRGLAPMIGFRRVRAQRSGRSPAVVIVLAIGISVFASVVQSSIDAGRETHAWHTVGADLRVDGHAPGARLVLPTDTDTFAGDTLVAEAVRLTDISIIGADRAPRVTVLALDERTYLDVIEATPLDADLRRTLSLLDGAPPDDATPSPIPMVIVGPWPSDGSERPRSGAELELGIGRETVATAVVGALDRFPSLTPGELAFIVPIESVRSVVPAVVATPTTLFVRPSSGSVDAVAAEVHERAPIARVQTRTLVLAAFTDDQFGRWVRRGFLAVTVLSGAFAIAAAVSSIALTAASRRRDLGYLRTLGLRLTQATAITAIEQVPMFVLAIAAGAGLGVGTASLIGPALDLDAVSGRLVPTELVADVAALAVVVGGFTLAIGIALTVSLLAHRRADEAEQLRMGGD